MGLLDQQSRKRASGHLRDGPTRPAAYLAPHERLRFAYVYVGERRWREILGKISLPQPAGHGVLLQRRGLRRERKRVGAGKSVTVRVELGVGRGIKKKKKQKH